MQKTVLRSILFIAVSAVILFFAGCRTIAVGEKPGVQKCRALDALGKPIPKATIQGFVLMNGNFDGPTGHFTLTASDEEGRFSLPKADFHGNTVVRLVHKDYGTAEAHYRSDAETDFQFPVVKNGSAAEKAALHGSVVGPENHPIAGARVEISAVRTPSGAEFLAQSMGECVYTDRDGQFRIYPKRLERDETLSDFCVEEDGRIAMRIRKGPYAKEKTVPSGSTYSITVIDPSYELFPFWSSYKNSAAAVVHLERPELAHHFVFMGPDGEPLTAETAQRCVVNLFYVAADDCWLPLPDRFKAGPFKLMPGRYLAAYCPSPGVPIYYAPIQVTKDSPDELVFQFPPPAKPPAR